MSSEDSEERKEVEFPIYEPDGTVEKVTISTKKITTTVHRFLVGLYIDPATQVLYEEFQRRNYHGDLGEILCEFFKAYAAIPSKKYPGLQVAIIETTWAPPPPSSEGGEGQGEGEGEEKGEGEQEGGEPQ